MAAELEQGDVVVGGEDNDGQEQNEANRSSPSVRLNTVIIGDSRMVDVDDFNILSRLVNEADIGVPAIDLHDELIFEEYFLDENGRIIGLLLGGQRTDDWPPWDLSHSVSWLGNLSSLDLNCCRSVPWDDLASMPNLGSLKFADMNISALFSSMPETLHCSNIKCLDMDHITLGDDADACAQAMACLASQFPNLESLRFGVVREEYVPFILHGLANPVPGAPIRNSLVNLILFECHIHEDRLETILFDVLPQYTRLNLVSLVRNEIASLHNVAERLRKENLDLLPPRVLASRVRLSELLLNANSVLDTVRSNPKQHAALLTLLDAFPSLRRLGMAGTQQKLTPEIKHALRINFAGRALLGEGPAKFLRPIPLSIWPYVLERSYLSHMENCVLDDPPHVKEVHEQSGLYYLLRHGSALAGRACFDSPAMKTTSAAGNGSTPCKIRPTLKRPRMYTEEG